MNIIKSIREALQVSQSELADKFNIPIKSIRNWEQEVTTPPAYVPEMMIRICQLEGKIALLKREEDFEALDVKGE